MKRNNIGDFFFLTRERQWTDSLDTLDSAQDLKQVGAPLCDLPTQIVLPKVFAKDSTIHSNTTTSQYNFDSQWCVETQWWCNRLTVYLTGTTKIRGLPMTPIQLQFRVGLPFFAEPYKLSQVIITPISELDVNLVLDVSLPPFKSVECWATVLDTTGAIGTGFQAGLRIVCRNYGTAVTPDAINDTNVSKLAAGPTAGVIGF